MRVGFDYRPVLKRTSRRRGIGKYTLDLAQALLRNNRSNEFILYVFGRNGERWARHWLDLARYADSDGFESACKGAACQERNLPYLPKPARLNWILDLITLPWCLQKDDIQVFHATEITSIPRSGTAQIWAHVHDLIPLIYWEETQRTVPKDYCYALQRAYKRISKVDLITTDSIHSKKDICNRIEVPEEKVKVIYPGCSKIFRPIDPELCRHQLRKNYALKTPFLFYVGGADFRKNLKRLIDAFKTMKTRGYEGSLVLGGEFFLQDIPDVLKLRHQIKASGLAAWVVCPGFIPEADLPLFYSGSDLFVFPSLYEGFGLPVLEALQCGAVVMCGRTSSIPEVAGDAAVYFDPASEKSMVCAFESIYGDESAKHKFRAKGPLQAARFNWDRSAQTIHRLYEEAV